MVLLLATLLTATPASHFRFELDVGGMVNAAWYVPEGRERIQAALQLSRDAVFGNERLDFTTIAYALPAFGPLLATPLTDDELDRAMLITSAMLQTVGLSVAAARFFSDDVVTEGPVLSLSPIAGGRLGLSVRLTGF